MKFRVRIISWSTFLVTLFSLVINTDSVDRRDQVVKFSFPETKGKIKTKSTFQSEPKIAKNPDFLKPKPLQSFQFFPLPPNPKMNAVSFKLCGDVQNPEFPLVRLAQLELLNNCNY